MRIHKQRRYIFIRQAFPQHLRRVEFALPHVIDMQTQARAHPQLIPMVTNQTHHTVRTHFRIVTMQMQGLSLLRNHHQSTIHRSYPHIATIISRHTLHVQQRNQVLHVRTLHLHETPILPTTNTLAKRSNPQAFLRIHHHRRHDIRRKSPILKIKHLPIYVLYSSPRGGWEGASSLPLGGAGGGLQNPKSIESKPSVTLVILHHAAHILKRSRTHPLKHHVLRVRISHPLFGRANPHGVIHILIQTIDMARQRRESLQMASGEITCRRLATHIDTSILSTHPQITIRIINHRIDELPTHEIRQCRTHPGSFLQVIATSLFHRRMRRVNPQTVTRVHIDMMIAVRLHQLRLSLHQQSPTPHVSHVEATIISHHNRPTIPRHHVNHQTHVSTLQHLETLLLAIAISHTFIRRNPQSAVPIHTEFPHTSFHPHFPQTVVTVIPQTVVLPVQRQHIPSIRPRPQSPVVRLAQPNHIRIN